MYGFIYWLKKSKRDPCRTSLETFCWRGNAVKHNSILLGVTPKTNFKGS